MVESNRVQQGQRYHQKAKEMQIEALKRAYEEAKEMYGEENIISAVIHVDETTLSADSRDFVRLTKRGNLSAERRDEATKENAQDAEKFLEAIMQEDITELLLWMETIITESRTRSFTKDVRSVRNVNKKQAMTVKTVEDRN